MKTTYEQRLQARAQVRTVSKPLWRAWLGRKFHLCSNLTPHTNRAVCGVYAIGAAPLHTTKPLPEDRCSKCFELAQSVQKDKT